jgi:hypothetical protein
MTTVPSYNNTLIDTCIACSYCGALLIAPTSCQSCRRTFCANHTGRRWKSCPFCDETKLHLNHHVEMMILMLKPVEYNARKVDYDAEALKEARREEERASYDDIDSDSDFSSDDDNNIPGNPVVTLMQRRRDSLYIITAGVLLFLFALYVSLMIGTRCYEWGFTKCFDTQTKWVCVLLASLGVVLLYVKYLYAVRPLHTVHRS